MTSCDVIVPCYNYGRFLQACVDSVLGQPDCDVRVLILDDQSSDDSLAVARGIAARDPRVTVVHHAVNRGHIATYNEGIDWVSAKYMLLLSADDLLAPGALARALGLMERNSNVGFVYGRALKFSDESDAVAEPLSSGEPRSTLWKGIDFIKAVCATPVCPVPTATAVVRTSIQKRVGGYRTELPHAGDLEMWLRFAAKGDVGVIDALQAFTRVHGENMRFTYLANRMIGDYRQRHEAFRFFFASEWASAPGIGSMSALAYRRLAEEVLWDAAHAFEEESGEHVAPLARLAREIQPGIVRSSQWWKLSLKRLLGVKAWRGLAPAIAGAQKLLRFSRSQRHADGGAMRLMNGIDTRRS
jgi:glycosyltransferase involved in cell wall biosynthesis